MKLCIVNENFKTETVDGLSNYYRLLVNELYAKEIDITVITNGDNDCEMIENGIRIITIKKDEEFQDKIAEKLKELQKNGEIDILTYEFYTKIITPADAAGAARKVGQNYDGVFGNSFKRYPDANDEITKITENCSYDYTKSAWYLELQRLPKDLLFDGEQEMIDSWN